MSWSWLLSIGVLFGKLWSWLRGGHGYRVTVEARPEAAIEAEKKTQETDDAIFRKMQDELTDLTIEESELRADGDVDRADDLLIELHKRIKELRAYKSRREARRGD